MCKIVEQNVRLSLAARAVSASLVSIHQSTLFDTLRDKSSSSYSESTTRQSGGGSESSDMYSAAPEAPRLCSQCQPQLYSFSSRTRRNITVAAKAQERSTENTSGTELNGNTLIATVHWQFEPSGAFTFVCSDPFCTAANGSCPDSESLA